MAVDVYSELVAVIRALEEARIEYALCGAVALAAHGASRATAGIDIMVKPEAKAEIGRIAKTAGFILEALPMEVAGIPIARFAKLVHRRPVLLDVHWVVPKLRPIWDEREHRVWPDGGLVVVSRNGLSALAVTFDRLQDLACLSAGDESAKTIAQRLRATLNVELLDVPHGIDMSSRGIDDRLRDACEMSTLALALGTS